MDAANNSSKSRTAGPLSLASEQAAPSSSEVILLRHQRMRTMLGVGRPFDCNRTRVAAKTSAIARRHQDPHCETAPAVHFKEKGNFIARTLALAKRLITLTRELFLSRLEKMEKDDPSPGASQGGTAKVGSNSFSHITLAFSGMLYGSIAIFRLYHFNVRNVVVTAFTASALSSPFCKAWPKYRIISRRNYFCTFATRKSCDWYSPLLLKSVWRSLGLKQG